MILLPLFFLQLDCFEIYALVPGLAGETYATAFSPQTIRTKL
jgi:hypothetical protein